MKTMPMVLALCLAVLFGAAGCAAPATENKADPAAAQTVSQMLGEPEGWSEVNVSSVQMFAEGKTDASIALLERFVAAHPDFGGAHFSLADSHLQVAAQLQSATGTLTPEAKQHLETARRHSSASTRCPPIRSTAHRRRVSSCRSIQAIISTNSTLRKRLPVVCSRSSAAEWMVTEFSPQS